MYQYNRTVMFHRTVIYQYHRTVMYQNRRICTFTYYYKCSMTGLVFAMWAG
jgi:hypothetical protein